MIKAPWTDEQVAALNATQQTPWMHPFTCGSGNRMDPAHTAAQKRLGGDYGQLIATRDGWTCPACDYRQDWAHRHMLKPPGENPTERFLREHAAVSGADGQGPIAAEAEDDASGRPS